MLGFVNKINEISASTLEEAGGRVMHSYFANAVPAH
jgi:hypothetical protein